MANFHFLQPEWLLLFVPLLFVIGYLRLRSYREKNDAGQGVIAEHLATHFRNKQDGQNNIWPIYLAGLLAALIIIALSQPVWRQAIDSNEQTAPLIIVMDESQSMLKNDVSPSRNSRAHLLVNGLLERGLNKPVGIMATAGSSHLLIPPAKDPEIAKLYLGYLDPSVMPVDGGDMANLSKALLAISGLIVDGSSLLVVTDGMSDGIEVFKKMLADKKIPVATLAFTSLGEQTGKMLGGPVISGDNMTPNDDRLYNTVNQLIAKSEGGGTNWVDEHRLFILPIVILLLFWFRKGLTLYWAPAAVVMMLITPNHANAGVVDWFFTADQQGMLLLKLGKYKQASEIFEDPGWKGVACYYAEDWKCARKYFAKLPTEDAVYNMATAAAQGTAYKTARDLYGQLLEINPDYPHAKANYEQLVKIVININDLNKNQDEDGPPPEVNKKGEKNNNPDEQADGKKQKAIGQVAVKRLSAKDVLKSKEMTDRWLRDISKDPKAFVRSKFAYEYATQSSGKSNDN
jgi:Ca-activated chloride channel family protein